MILKETKDQLYVSQMTILKVLGRVAAAIPSILKLPSMLKLVGSTLL